MSVLGTSLKVAHDALLLGVDLLQFAPVAGLSAAGKALLNIWDAVALVNVGVVPRFDRFERILTEYPPTQTNRLQCLRLTARCAEILLSVRQDVHDAGDEVGIELAIPYRTLLQWVDSISGVFRLLTPS